MDDLDTRRERAARNQSLFREVNERITELSIRFGDELQPHGFVCECLDNGCSEMLELSHDEYERLREHGNRFFVLPGHQEPTVEDVVEATDRYVVVAKNGVGGEIAEAMNPRKVGAL